MAAKLNPHIVNWKTMALLLPFLFLPDYIDGISYMYLMCLSL